MRRAGGQKLTTLAVLGRGEFFGEMALLTGNLRSALAQAVSDVDLWALHQKDLDELMHKMPALAIGIGRVLSQRLSRATEAAAEGGPAAGRRRRGSLGGDAAAAQRPFRRGRTVATWRGRGPLRRSPAKAESEPAPGAPMGKMPGGRDRRDRPRRAHRRAGRPRPGPGKRRRRRRQFSRVRESMGEGLGNAGIWFASRSIWMKLQLLGVLLLFVWLCGISAPATVISAFSSNDVGLRNMAFLQTVTPIPRGRPIPTSTATLTPTPTESPTPTETPTVTPTFTPLPPTDTPTPTPRRRRVRCASADGHADP